MKNIKRIIVASIIVAIASQFNIGILGSDFRVSAGIIFFVIILYYYKGLKPVPMGLISGIAVYTLRVVIYFFWMGNFREVMLSYQLEILFYTFYGVIYSLLIRKSNRSNINQLLIIFITCDLSANLIEILARVAIEDAQFHFEIITTLFLVAIVRSCIVWLVLSCIKYYRMLLIKEEHEKRYTKLLWLTAQLKSEMYWMEKNMDNIEKVMSNSYALFEKVNTREDENSWADRALTIARNVHEIKKEYELAIRGIKELSEDKLIDEKMNFKDIINILDQTIKKEIIRRGKNIELLFEIGGNFHTSKHYYLMSIFRNLILNAMDSIADSEKEPRISFFHKIEEEQ
ncbi:MAG: signal transduction histidine kinase, partial [Clostridiales bacterium]|nr:signal transduction histidine kinase [Clostridiales bacterium]